MACSFCLNVIEGIGHDVIDMVVGDCVDDFSAALVAVEKVGVAQYPKVL